jgi:serine protease Do
VVEGATEVNVTLNDGKSVYAAALVGSDESSDLAVLKIQPREDQPLTAAKHGKSGYLVVGERVVAVGNPLGTLGGTVTDGIISATERQIEVGGETMTLIQTNAAINSGNSGGGLFNLKGELIGVVNAKYAESGVEGLAFAIPIDSAYEVEKDLIEFGYVRGRVDHGLTMVEVNDSNFHTYYYKYNIQTKGLYIVSSNINTDLKNKDRIVSVNGKQVLTTVEFDAIIESFKIGDQIKIVYERASQTYETTLVLEEYVPDHSIDFQK